MPSSFYRHIQDGNQQHLFTWLRNNSEVDYPSWTQSLDLSRNGLYFTFGLNAGSAITDFIYQAHWAYICTSMNSLRNDNLEFIISKLSIGQAISPTICPPVSEVSVHHLLLLWISQKLKSQEGLDSNASMSDVVEPKVIRRFKQTQPVVDTQSEPTLSKDLLAGVSILKLNVQLIQFYIVCL